MIADQTGERLGGFSAVAGGLLGFCKKEERLGKTGIASRRINKGSDQAQRLGWGAGPEQGFDQLQP